MAAKWEDDDFALIERKWSEGASASMIAEMLGNGATRNVVIGIVHRRQFKRAQGQAPTTPPRPKRVKPKNPPKPKAAAIEQAPPPSDPAPPPIVPIAKKAPDAVAPGAILTLHGYWPPGTCRWPVFRNVRTPDVQLFCGEPIDYAAGGKRNYCAACAPKAYIRPELSDRSRRALATRESRRGRDFNPMRQGMHRRDYGDDR